MMISNFCGCFSLRTGAVIAGFIELVRGSMGLTYLSTLMIKSEHHDHDNKGGIQYAILKGILVGLIIYFAVIVVLSMSLIIGGVKKSPSYILPPLSMAFVTLITNCICIVSFSVYLYLSPSPPDGNILIAWVVIGVVCVVQFYLWLIIDSLYKQLLTERHGNFSNDVKNNYHQSNLAAQI